MKTCPNRPNGCVLEAHLPLIYYPLILLHGLTIDVNHSESLFLDLCLALFLSFCGVKLCTGLGGEAVKAMVMLHIWAPSDLFAPSFTLKSYGNSMVTAQFLQFC